MKTVRTKCTHCGNDYDADPKTISAGKMRFCSSECAVKYKKVRGTVKCLTCGRKFKKHHAKQKWCSRQCNAAARKEGNAVSVPAAPDYSKWDATLWLTDLPLADRPGPMIAAAGESLGLGYRIHV